MTDAHGAGREGELRIADGVVDACFGASHLGTERRRENLYQTSCVRIARVRKTAKNCKQLNPPTSLCKQIIDIETSFSCALAAMVPGAPWCGSVGIDLVSINHHQHLYHHPPHHHSHHVIVNIECLTSFYVL